MKDARLTLRISEQEKKEIEVIAAKRDVSVAQLVREVLRDYVAVNKSFQKIEITAEKLLGGQYNANI